MICLGSENIYEGIISISQILVAIRATRSNITDNGNACFFYADNVPMISDFRAKRDMNVYTRIKHHLAVVSARVHVVRACIVAPSHLRGVIDNVRCMQHPL